MYGYLCLYTFGCSCSFLMFENIPNLCEYFSYQILNLYYTSKQFRSVDVTYMFDDGWVSGVACSMFSSD